MTTTWNLSFYQKNKTKQNKTILSSFKNASEVSRNLLPLFRHFNIKWILNSGWMSQFSKINNKNVMEKNAYLPSWNRLLACRIGFFSTTWNINLKTIPCFFKCVFIEKICFKKLVNVVDKANFLNLKKKKWSQIRPNHKRC